MVDTCYCNRCKRTLNAMEFYTSNNIEKYPPDGKLNLCKKCITAHVDNWDPKTYLWILEEIDVPYIPDEWNKLMANYANKKMTGLTIIGRYLSKMKLKQFADFRWKDNQFLQELADKKATDAMQRHGYEESEIAKIIAENNTATNAIFEELERPDLSAPEWNTPPGIPMPSDTIESNVVQEVALTEQEQQLIDQLTDDDKNYLCVKWGKSYRPEEWIALEQLYDEMMQSYDIQSAGDLNTLKIACKTSLKANQLLDLGDIDGAQKCTKMYNDLMKSGKWTAAQNKGENDNVIDSIGEIVAMCEKDGFIPRYYVDTPNDKVDRVIQDMQKYTHDLVTEELGLGALIENAIKNIEIEKESIKASQQNSSDLSDIDDEDSLFDYDNGINISNEDFSHFEDFKDQLQLEDEELLSQLLEGG